MEIVANMAWLGDSVRELINAYHDLNAQTIDELSGEPSPLKFMQYVSKNRPFVVRKGAPSWQVCRRWDASYLEGVMGRELVNVALTPYGNADSVIEMESNSLCFVKPYETEEPFDEVLRKIRTQERQRSSTGPIRYAQTQNDNLRNEYSALFSDVPKDIPFARIALRKHPEAINFWLGNSHSTTALHKDNYENIYVQVLGQKHFVLMPPVEAACVNEQFLPAATYVPKLYLSTADAEGLYSLEVRLDEPAASIPFATWDPDEPEKRPTKFSHLAKPMRVTLDEGDMLYLPALWYHKVSQSCSKEGICCAVNYWYDMEFSGAFYTLCSFVRSVGLLAASEEFPPKGDRKDAKDEESQ